jgi:hypothetical protein
MDFLWFRIYVGVDVGVYISLISKPSPLLLYPPPLSVCIIRECIDIIAVLFSADTCEIVSEDTSCMPHWSSVKLDL